MNMKNFSNKMLIGIGKSMEKHPYLTTEAITTAGAGLFSAASGALVGGVVGGIKDDETFLEGAAKGALISGGIGLGMGAALAIPSMKSTLSYLDISPKDAGKVMQGLGHDGINLLEALEGSSEIIQKYL